MTRLALVLPLVAAIWLAACGGDDSPPPKDIAGKLADLPGVTVTSVPTNRQGYQFFVLKFEQPVDHTNPNGPKFTQKVSLLHKDETLPMVAMTTGYWEYYGDLTYEVTNLLGANQISIEHRYFGESRPEPADWTKLTIEQMATDEHHIIELLKTVYSGAFVTTGASKGGMTAVYHHRFFPDDVAGVIPYVAPISFGAPDPRYVTFLDAVGTPACRQAVRDAALELLKNRRAQMVQRAMDQAAAEHYAYTRVPIDPAVESSIASIEWAFWQYSGVQFCSMVPPVTANDDDMFAFLDAVAPISDNDDQSVADFEAYYYQAYAQLGFPDAGGTYLDPYMMYTDADYYASLPTELPAYDEAAAMHDVDAYVKESGAHMLFIYGQWDPWTGGKFELGNATDSALFVQPSGTHGSKIARLAQADRDVALAKLQAWTGVTPVLPNGAQIASAPRDPHEPHIPSAMLRALRARR